jgi:hypothetical protein
VIRLAILVQSCLLALLLTVLALPVAARDSDGDDLRDGFESHFGMTDPFDRDSDGDGVVDSAEDPDRDHLGNLGEQRSSTHPGRRDTDGDGTPDGREDADRDGRSNAREQDRRPIPAGLKPALRDASMDRQPDRKRCQARHRVTKVVSCTFGDPNSDTTIVLAGDSHATMFLTAYKQIAKARGWRLVTMTKAACPAFLGMHGDLQYRIDRGGTCRKWRRNVLDRLAADPPDFVVFGHANHKLRTVYGTKLPTYKLPEVWRSSVARTLRKLPAQTRVLVMGRVPHRKTNPVSCLRRHPNDMSKCVARTIPSAKRTIDNAIRAGAIAAGGQYATLHDKICSYSPCPVVQGDILILRDNAHLTETFARKLRPSITGILDRKLIHPQ